MSDEKDIEQENQQTQSPREIIDKHKFENNHIHAAHNPKSSNAGLESALNKKELRNPLSTTSKIAGVPSSVDEAGIDSEETNMYIEEELDDIPTEGTVYGVESLLNRKWLWVIIAGASLFFFIFLIAVMFLLKNSDNLNYASGTLFANEEYEKLYQEVESVVSSYQSKYGVKVDKYLIISTLTAYQDNQMYFDETESGAYENYIDAEDEDSEGNIISKSIDEMTAKIEILAKYQIITNKSCSSDSSTMRAIASNDDSTNFFNFWTSASSKEKNYDCNGGSGYTLSIEEGRIDDENSGSAFYWNLIDENFLVEYYPQYFSGINDELYLTHAAEAVEYIYLYADALRNLDCSNSGSSSTAHLTTIYEECSGIKVLADANGQYAGIYTLEEYVAGVIADEFTPGYMSSVTNDQAAIKEELKAFAIVIRSYSINRTNGCSTTIRNSSSDQNFKPTDDALIWEAVNATAGMVITHNGNIISAEYDSFYKTNMSCNGQLCTTSYLRKPGTQYHGVSIPQSWLGVAAGGHGRGMSQWGSLYLATTGMKYDEIVRHFYDEGIEIQVLAGTTTSGSSGSNTTAYCQRSAAVAEGTGTCDGSSYYGSKTFGEDTLSSSLTMLSCTADQAEKAFKEIADACGTVPHAGAMRSLNAQVNEARSSTSFHYTGRAIDLATNRYQGANRYFYVTYDDTSGNDNSHYYRLYCKVTGNTNSVYASDETITPLKWSSSTKKLVSDSTETGTFLDVTAVLNSYGLYGIGPRSCVNNGNYMCTEWWHFQDTSGLVRGQTTFRQTLDQYYGIGHNYSGTPVANHLNKKWNGGSYS